MTTGDSPTRYSRPPCWVCVAGGFPEFCSEGHTSTVIRLAEAIDRSLQGPPAHTEPHPEWYIEDAEAIAEEVAEGDGWVLEHEPGFIGEFFKVNGVEFYLDVNGEGYSPPVLGAEKRRQMAEEAAWDEDESDSPQSATPGEAPTSRVGPEAP